ncbi:Acetyltransferase, ribosomal protein N-acetylase [Hyella patelloides LEGE 07179]|uniref:Acetyltransferase, ribosomal protein N-acetylase n=1 Tax=Hyella patelloides LEGE 07179 TaxID=945734 RepID=A0A563VSC5_9CYAN|nr:GNAT family N-acetyltransferase [Hyella patelloides]VEP14297.1 Acetyltransferase, ribosomal protein N-acetylase [Hyella patelloides LEGE 07179]
MSLLPTLKTQRLILRPLSPNDAVSIQNLASDRQIADTTISIPHPYPDGEAERYISKQIAEQKTGHAVTFAIELKAESKLIGISELREIETEHCVAELSYWLAVTAWGKGYMSEALKPVLNFGFESLSLNKIYAYHMARNPASGKVLQKNGFQPEGLLRQRVRKWGKFEDVRLLSLLHQEWKSKDI